MKLTPNFTLDELILSQTAARSGIDNTPDATAASNLVETAAGMEMVRTLLGNKPILISSGYRSPAVNALVGGAKTSQHTTGQAVDFTCPAFGTPRQVASAIVASGIQFDQVIWEYTRWVHISFTPTPRLVALTIDAGGTRGFA